MHNKIEELRGLAGCYLKGQILNDSQLAIKRHMAGCEECYRLFCLEYLLQKTFLEKSLLPEESLEEAPLAQKTAHSAILRIQRWKGRLELTILEPFQNDPKWSFIPAPNFAMARGTEHVSHYQSAVSEESSIQRRGHIVIVQLDKSHYPIEQLAVHVRDGRTEETYPFLYDEDTELYEVTLDTENYSKSAQIEVVRLQ